MSNEESKQLKRYLVHFSGGTAGGMVGLIVGYPLETVRVRMQTQSGKTQYKSAIDCVIKTLTREGIRGFYKGLATPLVTMTLVKTFSFGTYGTFKTILSQGDEQRERELPFSSLLLCAVGSGALNTLVVNPVDRIKILLQLQTHDTKVAKNLKHKASTEAIWQARWLFLPSSPTTRPLFTGPKDLIKNLIWRKLYTGLSATIVRDSVGYGVYFMMFEYLKKLARKHFAPDDLPADSMLPFTQLLIIGGCTGMSSWTVQFPIDVVKSRMHGMLRDYEGKKPFSFRQVWRHLYQTEGALGFYKGWRPAVLRAFPAHASALTTYEMWTQFFKR